jgi:hypothetical protein
MRTRYSSRIDAGEKWIRWSIQFDHVDRLCWILVCAISLAGCSERSQELEERVTQLQKELNRTQDELRSTRQALDATNEELARLKTASANASTSGPAVSSAAPVSPASGTPASGNQPAPPQQQPVARSVGLPADRSVTIQWPDSGRASVSANQNPVANPGSSASGVSSQQAGRSGSGGAQPNRVDSVARKRWFISFHKSTNRTLGRGKCAAAKSSATGVKRDRTLGSNCHYPMARQRAIAASAKLKQMHIAPNSAARTKSSSGKSLGT